MGITAHAANRMRYRKLDMDEVQRTALYAPRYQTYSDKWACINGSLVVIVSNDNWIITAYEAKPSKIERLMAA